MKEYDTTWSEKPQSTHPEILDWALLIARFNRSSFFNSNDRIRSTKVTVISSTDISSTDNLSTDLSVSHSCSLIKFAAKALL